MLIDTHCHIHSPEFFSAEAAEAVLANAVKAGINKIICIATSLEDSKSAIAFAKLHPKNCWASIGIHPHEAAKLSLNEIASQLAELKKLVKNQKVIAVGECGFDFYYNKRSHNLEKQTALLKGQLELALANNLPLSFHVRQAFEDFWQVYEEYKGVRGVLHSFTDSSEHAARAIKHKLYIGVNGIATFTTHDWQLNLLKSLPLPNIILETDSPFLTPNPMRGNINSPENVIYITKFLADLRGESETEVANTTTNSATNLFKLI